MKSSSSTFVTGQQDTAASGLPGDITPPMPISSPVRSHSVHSGASSGINGAGLLDPVYMKQISSLVEELQTLRNEVESMKKSAVKSQQEMKSAYESEINELRRSHEEQMKKLQKNFQDVIVEIDDEKKTRLALQVELERLKKTIMNN